MAACAVAGTATAALSQTPMACHKMNTVDATPPDKYPAPQKLTGIGNVHLKISVSPEAQMWFDQGLNLYHDFWDYESVRAFEQGVRVDPNCAMCYWGLYLAESFRGSSSKQFASQALAKAVSLKRRASKAERLYIESSAAHEAEEKESGNGDGKRTGESNEAKVLRKLVGIAPRDAHARILLAEALIDGYDEDGNPKPGTKEALPILQSVLKDEPDNSAANHYWIHAVEASPRPEQAMRSAEVLGHLAPASGHMVHMPGHIFYRTGDYARAEQSFGASTEADERYMQEQHVEVDDDWNYVHNLMYAIANLMEAGKLGKATELSAKLKDARGRFEATLYTRSPRDGIARLDPRLPVALRTADWDRALELVKAASPPESLPNLVFLSGRIADFATGMKALDSHDLAAAERASQQLDSELWRASERVKDENAARKKDKKKEDEDQPKLQVLPDALPKPLIDNLSIMSLELRASLLAAGNQIPAAEKLFAQAAREEKELGYREPPIYIRPVGETEAAALLAASAWGKAKAAYSKALVERPKSGFPLYGIALSSEKAGEIQAAAGEYAEFISAWREADPSLPQLVHARAFLAGLKGSRADNGR